MITKRKLEKRLATVRGEIASLLGTIRAENRKASDDECKQHLALWTRERNLKTAIAELKTTTDMT